MEPPGGRDSRFNLGYNMNLLSGETSPEIYGNPNLGRPSTSLQQLSPRHTMVSSACNRALKSDIYDERGLSGQGMGLDSCVNEINEDSYSLQSKKSPPSNGKKTKGRVKIKMEYIENKLRRYTTFSKRKTGIMKKAYELSTLTGTQVMLLVASETGHVYTFATRKLQPMITSEAGKALIQTCLNSPDPPAGSAGGDQRMSATGFEETELTYNISDDDSKEDDSGSASSSDEMETTEDTTEYQDIPPPSAEDPLEVPPTKIDTQNHTTSKPSSNNTKKSEQKTNSKDKKATEANVASTNQNFESTQPLIIPSICIANNATSVSSNINTVAAIDTTSANSTSIASTQLGTIITSALLGGSITAAQQGPTISSAQLGTSITPAQLGATMAAISNTPQPTNRLQALPLVLHTPTGSGYASTPDGMILGLLQGPNMAQPQIVAIPMSSVASINGVNVNSAGKDAEGKS